MSCEIQFTFCSLSEPYSDIFIFSSKWLKNSGWTYKSYNLLKFCELNFLGNVIGCNKMFPQLTNMTCSAFPFERASAHVSVPQILAGATIAASTSVTVTVFQVTSFPFPSITTCTQEISYAICATPIVPTWVRGAFILICEITSIAIEIQIDLSCYEMLTQNLLLSCCMVGSVLITIGNFI